MLYYDYSGYGGSDGEPSEAALNADLRAVLRFADRELGYPADRTVILGQSIGFVPKCSGIVGIIVKLAHNRCTRTSLAPSFWGYNLSHGDGLRLINVWLRHERSGPTIHLLADDGPGAQKVAAGVLVHPFRSLLASKLTGWPTLLAMTR